MWIKSVEISIKLMNIGANSDEIVKITSKMAIIPPYMGFGW